MNRITLCDYIASQNPKGAIAVLNESGMAYERPSNSREIATLLKQYLAQGGENALHRLAAEHPDRELLASNAYASFSGAVEDLLDKPKDNNLNASGCGCGGGAMLNCSGGSCQCKGCQQGMMNFQGKGSWGSGYGHFDGGKGERISLTNALLTIGVIALVYHVLKTHK